MIAPLMTPTSSLQATISKEELASLPTAQPTGKIIVVEREDQVVPMISDLRKSPLLGIDTETKPSFTAGKSNPVSLLQLATSDTCFLIRLSQIGLPSEVIDILQDPTILKIGLGLKDDLSALKRLQPFTPQGCVELQRLCIGYGIRELSLQKIYAIVCREHLSKTQRMSNWNASKLTEAQQKYAALDAWAPLAIYNKLVSLPTPHPVSFALL